MFTKLVLTVGVAWLVFNVVESIEARAAKKAKH